MASRDASAVETERNRMFIVGLRRIAGIPLNDERGGWKSTISTTTTRIRRRPVRHYRPAPDHERRQSMAMPDTTIYHNPACGTSRTTLGLIRDAGIEPRVIEYLKDPPDRATLTGLIAKMGVPRSAEHTSELQSLMRISYAVFCLKKNKTHYYSACFITSR